MTDWADLWHKKAAEFRAMAETATDPVVQKLLLEVAKEYERLATHAKSLKPPRNEANC
jgi:hypothetical protein